MSPEERASFARQLANAQKLAAATKQELYGYEWRNGSLRPMMRPKPKRLTKAEIQELGRVLGEALAKGVPAPEPSRRSALATERRKPSQGQLL